LIKISKLTLLIFLLVNFSIADPEDKQKPQWKGKIEYENGVKVIKNPREPLYGKITLELEEHTELDLAIVLEVKAFIEMRMMI